MKHFGMLLTLLACFALTMGCDQAKDAAKDAKDAGAKVVDDAKDAGAKVVDDVKDELTGDE